MGLELRQSLKLSQQLVMTPQLQQAIRLLQLSRVELVELVQQELLENPLLEEKEEVPSEEVLPEHLGEDFEALSADEKSLERSAEWEDYLGDFSSTSKQALVREYESSDDVLSYEGRVAQKPTLAGHLFWQISLSDMNEKERKVAEEIIGNLTSTGYFDAELADIAQAVGVENEFVEQVLIKIQMLDPVGIAARTPQECLTRQLKATGEQDPVLYELIEHYLPHIERRDFRPILRGLKINMDDLKVYMEILQRLDPLPGSWYGQADSVYIQPDVYVYEYNGELLIVLNEGGLPALQVSTLYEDIEKAQDSSASEYIHEKMRSAVWLIKSLYQRQRTLYKVAESITRFQADFFREGVSKLKPLVLREIAEDIDMHESTVSRITTNKYMATAHGVFELKFFFNSALDQSSGNQVGSESVKDAIKKLVAAEDASKPLSDEKICELLMEDLQVNIARRTVAKYRSALNIPSSSRRRKLF